MKIEEMVPLNDFTTLKVGGKAKYFVGVSSVEELKEVLSLAHKQKEKVFILGAGSNILIADEGFDGYVVRVNITGAEVNDSDGGTVELTAGAGERWDDVVEFSVNRKLWGLENLSGIPGSVGGAPVQNIGAYGVEVKDVVAWVEVYDRVRDVVTRLSRYECKFGYRDSIFKTKYGQRFVVTRVSMILSVDAKPNISYKDISEYIQKLGKKEIAVDELRRIVLAIRANKFPDTKRFGTAGSFFKNPIVSRIRFFILRLKHPDMPGHYAGWGKVKLSSAWILDNVCHLKGKRMGSVALHSKQPLVLVTARGATAQDVKKFSDYVKGVVYKKTKIKLEPEVTFINF